MPAVGGGPSPDQWKRMTKAQKFVYLLLVGAAIVFVGYLIVEKLSS
jgi:cell division protein FtsL